MSEEHAYFVVISQAPLMFVRVPTPEPRWREIIRAMTAVMRSHGCRQKDLHQLERQEPAANGPKWIREWEAWRRKLEAAYSGSWRHVPRFQLYDWQDGKFVLIRDARKGDRR